MQQDEAFNLMKMAKNIFLTGAAGSGKTYLLNKYISYLKTNNVAVALEVYTFLHSPAAVYTMLVMLIGSFMIEGLRRFKRT